MKKNMKKIMALALAATMTLGMTTVALAATIKVENALNGETYKAYKVFDVTNSGDNYAYTIAKDSVWKDVIANYKDENGMVVFTLTPSANNSNVLVVTFDKDTFTDGAHFAKYLSESIPDAAVCTTKTAESDGELVFDDMGTGYYFLDTSLGSLCSLDTTIDTVTVREKNTIPGLTKELVGSDKDEDSQTATVGEVIDFKIAVTDSKGTDKKITVHDTMSAGLTLDNTSFKVFTTEKVNDEDVDVEVATDNYSISTENITDGCTFHVEFTEDYVTELDENDVVYITYSAVVNEEAAKVTEGGTVLEGANNAAYSEYSKQTTEEDEVKVYTYKFDIVKTTKDANVLTGAKFKLYDAATAGNEIAVVKVENGIYRVAEDDETGVEIEAGSVEIRGLGNGKYYLEETEAPAGYNILTERKEFEIKDSDNDATVTDNVYISGGLQVINNAGVELPSTGGMGTTIFYVLGSIMALGAGVLLVTKKRVGEN